MAEHHLNTPLDEKTVRQLHAGDTVVLDGVIFGVRDATHIRMFDQSVAPPVDFSGAVLLHTAPSVKKVGQRYEPISVGTTTSMRMDRFTEALLRQHGVRGIIGKGGLSEKSLAAFEQHGGCYLAIVGGAAALETTQIEAIEAVYWEDLMPECIWQFRVRGLGPLTVAMDSHGASLYQEVEAEAERRLAGILRHMGVE